MRRWCRNIDSFPTDNGGDGDFLIPPLQDSLGLLKSSVREQADSPEGVSRSANAAQRVPEIEPKSFVTKTLISFGGDHISSDALCLLGELSS